MPAAALPLYYFDEIIAEDEIKFSVKGHRGGHISEKSPERRHIFSSAFLINITTLWLISPVGKGVSKQLLGLTFDTERLRM
jgi:hypothetical protein